MDILNHRQALNLLGTAQCPKDTNQSDLAEFWLQCKLSVAPFLALIMTSEPEYQNGVSCDFFVA